jgi:hypothetical protein
MLGQRGPSSGAASATATVPNTIAIAKTAVAGEIRQATIAPCTPVRLSQRIWGQF